MRPLLASSARYYKRWLGNGTNFKQPEEVAAVCWQVRLSWQMGTVVPDWSTRGRRRCTVSASHLFCCLMARHALSATPFQMLWLCTFLWWPLAHLYRFI